MASIDAIIEILAKYKIEFSQNFVTGNFSNNLLATIDQIYQIVIPQARRDYNISYKCSS